MNVEFFDHQDRAHPLNGAKLATAADLSSLRGGPPFFCELIGENGFTLLRALVTISDAFSTARVRGYLLT